MLKKFLIILTISFMLLPALVASASHTPLGRDGRASFVDPDSSVTLVYYNATLRIRTGFTSIGISMAIRNDSAENVDFLMGMPTQYDQFSAVENLSVMVRREALNVWIRRNTEQIPERWNAWTIPLNPGETVIVDTTFSIGNKTTPEGGEVVTLPLSYLGAFRGPVESLRVIADLDFHGAYAFHPAPSVLPAEYARGGRLSFVLDGFEIPQDDLVISFIPLLSAVPDYIAANTPDNQEISSLLELFRSRDYEAAIGSIDSFIAANTAFEFRRELEFLKALAYAELGRFDSVMEMYERLEYRHGFTGELAKAVGQKIIYDRSLMLSLDKNQSQALEYLENIEIPDEPDIFSIWLTNEIRRLTPPPPPPPPPPTPVIEEPIVEEPPIEEPTDTLPISPEMIVIIVFALILIIYLIIRKNRKRKRKFYFRKG